jgi:LPS export ABC transporter protein LptC
MILRVLFALMSLAVLAALLYLQDADNGTMETSSSELGSAEPGFSAVHAELVGIGDDGLPIYILDADRIEQPHPQGTVYLTAPRLDYQLQGGNHWTLTAQRGQMPEDASSADLAGTVHAQGLPSGSRILMRIDTEALHLDMTQQLATSAVQVHVSWGNDRLDGTGLRADLKNDTLTLASKVHGVLFH